MTTHSAPYFLQAYTSQFVALTMFGLMMSEDRISLQKRRLEIINGLRMLPGQPDSLCLSSPPHNLRPSHSPCQLLIYNF